MLLLSTLCDAERAQSNPKKRQQITGLKKRKKAIKRIFQESIAINRESDEALSTWTGWLAGERLWRRAILQRKFARARKNISRFSMLCFQSRATVTRARASLMCGSDSTIFYKSNKFVPICFSSRIDWHHFWPAIKHKFKSREELFESREKS